MSLWVPPSYSSEHRAGMLEHDHIVVARSRLDSVCDTFNRELRTIDRHMQMRFFDEDGAKDVLGAVPNRYHLVRKAPDAPTTLIVIEGPGGEYVEPNSSVYDMLRRSDLWNGRAVKDQRQAREAAERAGQRQRNREAEERREELKDRYNAAFRTQVSMDRGTPWSQNARGARGRSR